MGNATAWLIWLGIVVSCLAMTVYSVRSKSRSAVLGVVSLGIGLLAGWLFVSALLKGHPAFFLIVFGSMPLPGLLGAARPFFQRKGGINAAISLD